MKTAVIAFSKCGAELALRIKDLSGHDTKCFLAARHAEGTEFEPFESVYALAESIFSEYDALVFISASGIAVRAVAPLIKSKLYDPAVVVCDETGRFAISLLSGHAGGANKLAEDIAALIGAQPVITTASDSHTITEGLSTQRNLVLGIGCRRGLSAEVIERAATIMLWDEKIPLARVVKAASIDIKSDEKGLLLFAEAHGIPIRFYSAAELLEAEGEFTSSERVLRTVGVDNVCERAAVLCGGSGKLIMRKTAMNGVTVAVFLMN